MTLLVRAIEATSYLEGQHTSMVLVDVEKFGDPARTDTDQLEVRSGMYGALKHAFAQAGIPWERCEIGDRGDGAMILIPPDVSKNRLVARLPAPLIDAIEQHNADNESQSRIRLRVALHAGEIHRDEHGQTGDQLNFAFRMLDSAAAKKALASSHGVLIIIASEWFYYNVIRHDRAASPQNYRPVQFRTKETTAQAWISWVHEPVEQSHRSPGAGYSWIIYARKWRTPYRTSRKVGITCSAWFAHV